MSKPSLKTVLGLKAIDDKIKELYELRAKNRDKLIAKYGEATFCYELKTPTEKGEKYIRMSLIDNVGKLGNDTVLYKAAAIMATDVELKLLKREPKEGLS
jgi:hypothetical protein